MLDGVVVGFDGVLADTLERHERAWQYALSAGGLVIARQLVAAAAPQTAGGLTALLGSELACSAGPTLRRAASHKFAELCASQRVRVLPGAIELLVRLRDLGIQLAVATTGAARELRAALDSCGLHLDRLVDAVVTAEDAHVAGTTVAAAAASRLGLHPAQCVWITACGAELDDAFHAGMACVALVSPRPSSRSRLGVHPRAVYAHVPAILAELEPFLHASSPVEVHVTQALLEGLMRSAITAARKGLDAGEVPFGSAVAAGDGTIVASAHQWVRRCQSMLGHSLLLALREAGDRRPAVAATTIQPCAMCLAAAAEAGVETVAFGTSTETAVMPDEGSSRSDRQQPRIVGAVLDGDCRILLRQWLHRNEDYRSPHHAFVERLIAGA